MSGPRNEGAREVSRLESRFGSGLGVKKHFGGESAKAHRLRSPGLRLGFCATQSGDHFGKLATRAIRGIRQAKILEYLEKSLLLVKESDMCLGAIDLSEQTPANDCQSPIA